MATNKRKEAAALFELIDKSTLKVPKNAGALRIPSWWSSKSNPPAPGEEHLNGQADGKSSSSSLTASSTNSYARPATSPALVKTASPAPSRMPAPAPSSPASLSPGPASVPSAEAPAENGAQHRLFEPPPAHSSTPPTMPSIRPPAPQMAVSPSLKAPPPPLPLSPPPPPPPSPISAAPAAVEAKDMGEEEAPESLAPQPARVARPFAPQTHAQTPRQPWTPPRGSAAGILARVPLWAFLAAAAGIVIVICLLVVLLGGLGTGKKASPGGGTLGGNARSPDPSQDPGGGTGRGMIPPPGEMAPVANRDGSHVTADPPPVSGPARVYMPGEAARSPELVYIIIAHTPEYKIAERNANKIAENGVSVSIEHMKGGMYGLVSVQGFRSSAEGESLRKKIIEIGKQVPGKGWNDAYFSNVRKPASAG